MTRRVRSHIDELRGATRLAIAATRGITALVEKMHVTIASGPAVLGQPLAKPARLATGVVYGAIQGVTALVGTSLDVALAQLAPLVAASSPGLQREAVLAVVNGVLGDYLEATANPLAIELALRRAGAVLELAPAALRVAVPQAASKLAVLIHGSCMTDRQFLRAGHDHGAALERDLGYTAIYVRYNSGRHISTNARALAVLLDELVAAWPVPVDELVLIGHSMGGLVARSACHTGGTWRPALRALVTIGTPHHGAPLERAGNVLDQLIDVSPYTAPFGVLGRIRSAGITDLRFGNVLDEHWHARDRFEPGRDRRTPCPLPEGVACFALAGTRSPGPGARLRSDGLVPVDSALGIDAQQDLGFPEAHRSIALATGHRDLLGAAVYPTIRDWLT